MHTLAMPKSILCIELGPQLPLAHYELAYWIKKMMLSQVRCGTKLNHLKLLTTIRHVQQALSVGNQ